MTEEDRLYWDDHYRSRGSPRPGLPPLFATYVEYFPRSGQALELACGTGEASVAMALRGLGVLGVDISASAIRAADDLASSCGVACSFAVADLDDGLPSGPSADIILCHMFRDGRLDEPILERLAPGGILALACLSEVGPGPGRFRAAQGELQSAFAPLDAIATGEGEGRAWILARKPSAGP